MEKLNYKKEKNREICKWHTPSVIVKNSTSGITLIALIITIIVLLILARGYNISYNWK